MPESRPMLHHHHHQYHHQLKHQPKAGQSVTLSGEAEPTALLTRTVSIFHPTFLFLPAFGSSTNLLLTHHQHHQFAQVSEAGG